jgi:hypothetical protein
MALLAILTGSRALHLLTGFGHAARVTTSQWNLERGAPSLAALVAGASRLMWNRMSGGVWAGRGIRMAKRIWPQIYDALMFGKMKTTIKKLTVPKAKLQDAAELLRANP